MAMEFKGKRIAVLGFGAEGRSAAKFLLRRQALVGIYEGRKREAFTEEELREFEVPGVTLFFEATDPDLKDVDAVLRSPGIPPNHIWLETAQNLGLPITSGTAIFFEECPGKIIGVTGTKGKGTTSSFIFEMLRAAGKEAFLLGNIGSPALEALSKITEDSIVVYELSSFQLMEVEKSPQVAVVLMVTEDHLDFHGSVEDYAEAKKNIVKFQKPTDAVVANQDYERTRAIADSSAAKKYWVSRFNEVAEGAFVEGESLVVLENGKRTELARKGDLAIYGEHNLENALAASMVGYLLGLLPEDIRSGLRNFKGLPHRLQFVKEVQGVRFFDDSISTTPESAIAAIRAFKEPKILILGGSSKNADFSGLAEEIIRNTSVKAIVGMGEEWPRIKEEISRSGIRNDLRIVEDIKGMSQAVHAAFKVSNSGDVVLLSPACASFGMFRNYKDRGEKFSKEIGSLPGA